MPRSGQKRCNHGPARLCNPADWPVTPEQCREAGRLLGWHQQRLAIQANSCLVTVAGSEVGTRATRATSVAAFRAALEPAGVEFPAEDDFGAGVRLRKGGPSL